ncbi:MAG: TfoX/Sxy family protein [Polyangiaceae bacterium]|nr:TfoX/Sxy family protein [Myxococcales bacterium]MCB9587889.1 TfoX/Sxy family protein [Polyangiaceae bacterium]MCB9608838.1 TfoX/Sxy family protein [Polyangiaceae bacterium]
MAYDEKLAARIRKLLSASQLLGAQQVEEKRVMGKLAFMVNGSMCCSVSEDSLLIRVHPEEREALLSQPHVSAMQMGKRTMRGFVRIAPPAYRSVAALRQWLERGINAGAK